MLGEKSVHSKQVFFRVISDKADSTISIQGDVVAAWTTYLIKKYDMKFTRVVMAQMILETGGFTSTIFKENLNYFGMKPHDGCNCWLQNGHAAYSTKVASIEDYAKYQKRILGLAKARGYVIATDQDYLWLLDHLPVCSGCRYAEDPNYTDKLSQIIEQLRGV